MANDYVLSIDVGGTNTAFGLVDQFGHCIYKDSIPTNSGNSAQDLFSHLFSVFSKKEKDFTKTNKMVGIGIGVPNGNYYTGEVISPPNLGWENVNLVSLVKHCYDMPVAITNDANAAALGEMRFGAARGMRDFIEITLGTGLGSGIVVDGNVVYGHSGFAGELGHVLAVENGRLCGCGRRGCLETYASATGIVKSALETIKDNPESSSKLAVKMDTLTSKDVFEAANQGDKLARLIFMQTGQLLGKVLSNSVLHTSPEAIIFFGGLSLAGELILAPIRESVNEHVMTSFKGKTKILASGLPGDEAAILGAAALIWEKLENGR